jgi:hypothetical protein
MNKKKLLIVIISILIIIGGIRIFFGTINITLKIPFNNPTYVLKVNDQLVSGNLDVKKKNTFIPYVVNLKLSAWLSTKGESRLTIKQGDNINLTIEAYDCFSNITGERKLTACSYDNSKIELEEIEDVKYSMIIRGGSPIGMTNTLIYDGAYQNNLTTIMKEKGIYTIEISAKHNDIESTIHLLLEII